MANNDLIPVQSNGVIQMVTPTDLWFYLRAGWVKCSDEGVTVEEVQKPLDEMTIQELRDEAKKRGIKGVTALPKQDLLDLLSGEQPRDEGEEENQEEGE